MTEALHALRLSALEHERWRLGYATTASETFARNVLTDLLESDYEEGSRPPPRITFYAQPTALDAPLDVLPLANWLDPNDRRYEPAPGLAFVPSERRGIADGIVAFEDWSGHGRIRRFLAVRRTGSVEYGVRCAGWHPQQQMWAVSLRRVVLQFAQFVRFLDDLAGTFTTSREWRIWCNARDVAGAALVGFAEGWAEPFQGFVDPPRCWEDRFQLEFAYVGGGTAIDDFIGDMADRFELAFGSTLRRARARTGSDAGAVDVRGAGY